MIPAPRSMLLKFCLASSGFLGLTISIGVSATWAVDFQRDIQPILSEHCANCHGVDVESREAGLRLDVRDKAFAGGDSGEPAIIAGDPQGSALIQRIESNDPDIQMPPPDIKKPLSEKQKKLLANWIQEGAVYQSHWAFGQPRKPELDQKDATHPIDVLVSDHLQARGLTASPKAAGNFLCRRLYLDLIGLPPSLQELSEFHQQGFEATVDRLLQDERYGEKWARHWLDVARYSDTNGYEKDLRREQWAWRDWVIGAYNRDLPYNQFVIEQLAGDLLPDATPKQHIATGFLRNSMINEEGAIVPEQFRMFEMFDRMDCLGKAVLGLTIQCAQCHSHKFDPITQEEYYGMFAFLNNTYEAQSAVYSTEQLQQLATLDQEVSAIQEQIKLSVPKWEEALADWEQQIIAEQPDWTPLVALQLESVSGLNHPIQLSDHSLLMLGHVSSDIFMISQPEATGVTGLRLEILPHGDLPYQGPGRGSQGDWDLQEIEVYVRPPNEKNWKKLKLVGASADYSEPEKKSKDDKKTTGPVALIIDGSKETSWKADRGIGRRNQASVAVVQFEKELEFPQGTQWKLALHMGSMVGCCRFSWTSAPAPRALPVDHAAILAMQLPVEERKKSDQASLFRAWRKSRTDCQKYNRQIDSLRKRAPTPMTSVLHLAQRESPHQRKTSLLLRGAWDQPEHEVLPHTPAILPPLPADAPVNRLTFARWLVSEQSPLAARVAVNRIWQALFGAGLVETPEDFGSRSPMPQYLKLLDWLAVELVENGWSQKKLIRTIVTSNTYQQSSKCSPEQRKRDPLNQLLARGPRFRCDAEVVRDIALSVSGLLTPRQGGPPVIPPVPQNVLDYNYVYPGYWKPATGPDRYRRTLYGFRKRSMPDPVMSNLDGPNGDIACARRVRSNTPLAALTGLNETIFVESARALAVRILREGGANDPERITYAYQLCAARNPIDAEQQELLSLLAEGRQRLADGWLNPREIATGNSQKLPQLPPEATPQDAAAWTIVARVLLNLDETISKN